MFPEKNEQLNIIPNEEKIQGEKGSDGGGNQTILEKESDTDVDVNSQSPRETCQTIRWLRSPLESGFRRARAPSIDGLNVPSPVTIPSSSSIASPATRTKANTHMSIIESLLCSQDFASLNEPPNHVERTLCTKKKNTF